MHEKELLVDNLHALNFKFHQQCEETALTKQATRA